MKNSGLTKMSDFACHFPRFAKKTIVGWWNGNDFTFLHISYFLCSSTP